MHISTTPGRKDSEMIATMWYSGSMMAPNYIVPWDLGLVLPRFLDIHPGGWNMLCRRSALVTPDRRPVGLNGPRSPLPEDWVP